MILNYRLDMYMVLYYKFCTKQYKTIFQDSSYVTVTRFDVEIILAKYILIRPV